MGLKYMLVLTACIGLLGVTVEVRSQQQCSGTDPTTNTVVQGTCFANCPAGTQSIFDFSLTCGSSGALCCSRTSGTGGTGGGGGGIGVVNPTGLTCGIAQANINGGLGNGILGPIAERIDGFTFNTRNDVSARSARILGGTTVSSTASRHCWIAQILGTTNNGQSFSLRGAGAIVNGNYIITSASAASGLAANQLRVRVGATATFITAGSTTELLLVSNVVTFTGYRKVPPIGYPVGDVALLRLSTAIDFTTNTAICGACLPNATATNAVAAQDLFLGERCHVAGYGVTAAGATTNDNLLREVMVPVLPAVTCSLLYRSRLNQQNYNTDLTAICAGGQQGKDTCTRDGGAPLACISPAAGRQFYMVAGVSSWGIQCGQQGIPSVYTNLANPTIQTWINNISGGAFPQPTQSSLCPINGFGGGGLGGGGFGGGGTGGGGILPIN